MASLVDACVFIATGPGTGDFVVASPKTGWRTPSDAGASNGGTYRYRAYSDDQSEWEIGTGVYDSGTDTLVRSVVAASSNSNSKVDFTQPPNVALTAFSADFPGDGRLEKIDYITVTGGVDLDAVAGKLALLTVTAATDLDSIRTTISGLGTASTKDTGTAAGEVPVLDANGLLDTSVLPSIAITDVFTVADQAAMLALTAQQGDVAIRTDLNKSFILSTNSPSTLADWKEILTPTDAVLSVAGLTGAITDTALKTALSIAVADSPQFAGINLGHASDTTLTRSAAGRIAVEGADVLLASIADQTITGGARVTPLSLGNLSGASITPDPGDRPIQTITNNGAGSILPGSNEGQYTLQIINTTGAGAITTTGWTLKGDSFDTTTTSRFVCSCLVTSDIKLMTIVKVA